MPRNKLYIRNFLSDIGHNIRLEILIADTSTLSSPATEDIPDGIFLEAAGIVGNVKFKDEIYIGIPLTDILKFKVDLNAFNVSSAMVDLRTYLIDPESTADVSFTVGPSGNTYTHSFRTQNVWTFYSDLGAGTTPTNIIYQGVQNIKKSIPMEPEKNGVVEMEIELTHIGQFIYGKLSPVDFYFFMLAESTTGIVDEEFAYAEVYNLQPENYSYAVQWGNSAYRMAFHRLCHIYFAVATLGTEIYKKLMRNNSAHAYIESASVTSHTYSNNGTPYDHWTLYGELYNETGTPDLTNAIATNDRWICTSVYITGDSNNVVGGLIYTSLDPEESSDTSGTSMEQYTTLFDFLSETCEQALAKGVFTNGLQSGNPYVLLRFFPPDAVQVSALTLSVNSFQEVPSVEYSAHRIAGAAWTITGGVGSDVKATYRNSWAIADDSEWNVPRGFNCVGSIWNSRGYAAAGLGELSSAAQSLILRIPDINPFTIFYYDDADGLLTGNRFIKCNHEVRVNDGTNTYGTIEIIGSLPTPTISGTEDSTGMDVIYGDLVELYFMDQQLFHGIHTLTGKVVSIKFGKKNQTKYETQLSFNEVNPTNIGEKIDGTGFPDGNIFLSGGSYLGILPGTPKINTLDYDILKGTVKAGMLAPGS